MFGFVIGLIVAGIIGWGVSRRKEAEFTRVLIAIHEGKAEPDENGNVGWLLGV